MDGKMVAGVLAISLLLIVIGIYFSRDNDSRAQTLPWQIEQTPQHATRVFGLTLGGSTLHEAEARLKAPAEISLFSGTNRALIAEAFFDKVTLGGLAAKMVLIVDLPQEVLRGMYQRGTRISTLEGGTHKVTLSAQDQEQVGESIITSITYLPQARLSEATLIKRFGAPAERVVESTNSASHLLYPARGLDIALNREGYAVLQYVNPSRFMQLKQGLEGRISRGAAIP